MPSLLTDVRAGGSPMIRLCICDDHGLFAEALEALLVSAGHSVVARIDRPESVLAVLDEQAVDVCIMDLDFPGNEHDVLEVITEVARRTKVVVLTGHGQTTTAPALHAGASGWASKLRGGEEVLSLLMGVHGAADGDVAGATRSARRPPLGPSGYFLTEREREVLLGLVRGEDTAAVAARLGVRPATVRAHLQSLFAKLGVHSRLEAVALAVEKALVLPPSAVPMSNESLRRPPAIS